MRLWDICFFFLEPIANFAMSNDGKCLALSCLDSKIRLIERGSGEMLSELKKILIQIQ